MTPTQELLTQTQPPTKEFLSQFHNITNFRNALTVLSVYAQTICVIALSAYLHNLISYFIAVVLMGRAHTQNGELMHNSMHRSLFSNKNINDFVGRWFLAYPSAIMFDRFKYYHLVHHAKELGEKEPETPIYANYPITKLSLLRKFIRDASGFIGVRNLYYIYVVSPRYRPEDKRYRQKIVFVQLFILVIFTVTLGAQYYFLLWVIPWLTSRRVIERLYAITEHGGMTPSNDVRKTTHFVNQTYIAKFLFMPLNRGHHMAHHIDPRIPFRDLPKVTKEMRSSGFIPNEIVHKNYISLLRKLSSKPGNPYSEIRIPG
jgi:fatty acid desaturase